MSEFEVTQEDLPVLIKAAYALSRPQGMGFLHAREGDLDEETVQAIILRGKEDPWCAASMDYVHGRAVKLSVKRENRGDYSGPMHISAPWYDHTGSDFDALVKAITAARKGPTT